MFKPGDRVVCIDPVGDLQLGKVYTVTGLNGSSLTVMEIKVLHGYFPRRFKLLSIKNLGTRRVKHK